FPTDIVARYFFAVDRAVAILRKHDRDFRADPRAGGAVGLAVALVLHLNLAVGGDAVHGEKAETQKLHAGGRTRVVGEREPRFAWWRGVGAFAGGARDRVGQRHGIRSLRADDA